MFSHNQFKLHNLIEFVAGSHRDGKKSKTSSKNHDHVQAKKRYDALILSYSFAI